MPATRGCRGSVDAVYCGLAGALIAGLARLGVEAAIARHERHGGATPAPGRCASRASRAPTCGSATARCAARRRCGGGRGAAARLDPPRAPARSTRPTSWCPGVAVPCPRPTICAGSPSRWGSWVRPATRGWWAARWSRASARPSTSTSRQGATQRSTSGRTWRPHREFVPGRGYPLLHAMPPVRPPERGRRQLLLVVRRARCRDDEETTLSLTELADRLELDEELGEALAELPAGHGHARRAAGPERREPVRARRATSPRSAATPTPTSSSTTSPSPAATR